jgi:zinc protease
MRRGRTGECGARTLACRVGTFADARRHRAKKRRVKTRRGTHECVRHGVNLLVFLFLPFAAWAQTAPAARPAAHAAAPAPAPSYKDLKFSPLKPISIPKVETFTLPNGMRVSLLEDRDLPLIGGSARIRTGNLFDPPDKIGLATITGMALRTGGTKTRTGDQIDAQLEDVAASVESRIDETYGAVSFSCLKENADDVLAVFHDLLTAPEFRAEKVELAKTQMRSSIARRNDDAHGILERQFADIVYGPATPYGWDEQYDTINRIARADVQEFYQRYFFPANAMLAVHGDFDAAQMRAKIEKLFADWTAQQQPVPAFPKVAAQPAPGVYLATKTDVSQTFFSIGHLGGEFRDKDYAALEIAGDILGGGFQSRLFQLVRTRMGNAYQIYAGGGGNYDHPGLFQISGSTKSVSTAETIKVILAEVDRLRTAEVTDAELKAAKDTALNSLVFAFDSKAKTLNRLLNYEYYGYPKDFIQQYQSALAAVTRADVLRVAKERLNPANFTIVAVGNPEHFGAPLDSLGLPIKPIDLTIPEARLEEKPVDPERAARGKKLLQRVQQAVGGSGKLAAVHDYRRAADYQLDPSKSVSFVKEVEQWIAPSYMRQELIAANGGMLVYSDGKTCYMRGAAGAGQVGGETLQQIQGDLLRSWFQLLLSDRIAGRTVSAVDDRTLEISDRYATTRLVVSPDTGLPERLLYQSYSPGSPPKSTEEIYSDYRELAGVRVPYKVVIMEDGQKLADATVTSFQVNNGLKVEDLAAH